MVVMTLAILGVNTLPARLVKYREKGVLRRLSTTPANPRSLLVAQLIVNMGVASSASSVLLVVGNLVFQIPLPQDLIGFAAAFLARHVGAVRPGPAGRRRGTDDRHRDRPVRAAVRARDVPRWGIPAANAAAGVPGPHR